MLTDAEIIAFAATTDLERSHAFYSGVLGLRHVESSPYANVYDAHGTILRVTPRRTGHRRAIHDSRLGGE